MVTVKGTFLFEEDLFKAFKVKCKSEGRSMTWVLSRCMRETVGLALVGEALAGAGDRDKALRKAKRSGSGR